MFMFKVNTGYLLSQHGYWKDQLKEKDQKQLNYNKNESVSKTKLFGANFMQIRL